MIKNDELNIFGLDAMFQHVMFRLGVIFRHDIMGLNVTFRHDIYLDQTSRSDMTL